MKCEDVLLLISGHIDGENTAEEEQLLQAHLCDCEDCRRVLQAYEAADAGLMQAKEPAPEGLCADVMAAVTGDDLQAALFSGTAVDRIPNAIFLDGFQKILIVLCLPVDGEGMLQKLKEICRVQPQRESFPLFWDRQIFEVRFAWGCQAVSKNLGNGNSFRAFRFLGWCGSLRFRYRLGINGNLHGTLAV